LGETGLRSSHEQARPEKVAEDCLATMKNDLAIFEGYGIRRSFDEKTETWFFSVVDIVQVLTQQPDYKAARNYWKVLKHRLTKEGSESVTNCNQLKNGVASA
jgi:DNA-damage-inducible protein D